jgi:hypothetical protein
LRKNIEACRSYVQGDVKEDERALTRDGCFVRVLEPPFTAYDYGRHLAAEVVKVVHRDRRDG